MSSVNRKKTYLNLPGQEFDRRQFNKIYLDQRLPAAGKPWTDELFPNNDSSIYGRDSETSKLMNSMLNQNSFEWKRVKDFINEPMLFEDKINPNVFRVGEIANTYFLSVLSALEEYPNLINQIFITKQTNQEGVYQVSLFIDGEFQTVFVDDFFPISKTKKSPIFTKTTTSDFWGMILEKAWAKVNGGYANIMFVSVSDLLRALTGFSCETIDTKEMETEKIWLKIKNALNNKFLVFGNVRGDDNRAKKMGLVPGSTYNFLYFDEVREDTGKKQYLVKVKNAWGANVWNGDYSELSTLWNENIREQIVSNHLRKTSDNVFWIPLKDIIKYFGTIEICHLIFGGHTQMFNYKASALSTPHVFNINIKDPAVLSISVYERKWRFNKGVGKNAAHPTSLILAQYDPDTREIKNLYTNYCSDNDTEIGEKVDGGYYILWVYKPNDIAQKPKPDLMKIKICADEEYNVQYFGPDQDFLVISDIVAQSVRYKNRSKIKRDGFFYDIQNSLGKSGIAYRVILNNSTDLYEEWDNDASQIEGIVLLPPYQKQKKFSFRVGPSSYMTVLGIQKEEFGTQWFNLKSKITQLPFDLKKIEINNPTINPKAIYIIKFDNDDQRDDYVTSSYDVATTQVKFPISRAHQNKNENKLRKNYQKFMNTFSHTFPSEMKNKLTNTEIKKGDITFIGGSNPKTKEGSGVFYDSNRDMTLVTTWRDQDETSFGQIYNGDGQLIYEGEIMNGICHGKGNYFFPGGEKYVGNFVNGNMEGNGIFYWDDGCRWEGTFSNNKLNGSGTFYNPKTKSSFNATYKNNRLVQERSSSRKINKRDESDEED